VGSSLPHPFHRPPENNFVGEQGNPFLGLGVIPVASAHQLVFPVGPFDQPRLAEMIDDSGLVRDGFDYHAPSITGAVGHWLSMQNKSVASRDAVKSSQAVHSSVTHVPGDSAFTVDIICGVAQFATAAQPTMKCPYCNHEFPLTWKRYWLSPAGRHVCPGCHQPSRFRITAMSWLRNLIAIGIGGIPAGLILHFWLGGRWWFAGWILGGLLTGVPIDKFMDERFRKLEMDKTKNAP
jgi:hypothetical protein